MVRMRVVIADNDPDDPPTLQEDGAPSPLAAAVQGVTPSQDVPEGRAASRSEPARGGVATLERPEETPRAEMVVRQAAQFTAGAMGMGVMAVLRLQSPAG